jgi:elongation factor 2
VSYKETITKKCESCLSKSPNNHNKIYISAEPLDKELIDELEKDLLPKDEKKLSKHLVEKYKWEEEDSKKIWSLGNEENNSNILVNLTKGVNYINDVKEMIINAFLDTIQKGVLCEEPLRVNFFYNNK